MSLEKAFFPFRGVFGMILHYLPMFCMCGSHPFHSNKLEDFVMVQRPCLLIFLGFTLFPVAAALSPKANTCSVTLEQDLYVYLRVDG
jgi:hypothetical protein